MLIVTYAVAFLLELFQKAVCLLAFNKHIYTRCIYKLISILQDVLIRSLFQREKTTLEQVQSRSNLLLLVQKTQCASGDWKTCAPFPQANKPLAIIHLKHPDLLHYHQTNICPRPSGVHKLGSPAVGRHD